MKSNKWLLLALAVIFVFNVILLNRITALDEKLLNFSSQISMLENQLYDTVVSLRSTVSEELKNQNKLVVNSDYAYGEADIEKGTVAATVTVTPKEYTEDTKAYLILENNEVPMELENGMFKSDVELSVYDEFSVDFVRFSNEDGIRNEQINLRLSPRYDFLPVMFAKYRGKCTSVKKKDAYEATYNGQITINLERKKLPIKAQKIEMVECLNGEEIGRTNVPLNTTPFEIQSGDGSFTVAEEVLTPYDSDWQGSKAFYYQLDNKKVTIPYGSVYEIYIELSDDIGLMHRMPADTREISENGMPVDRVSTHLDGATIYNAQTGEMLYQKTYSLVK